MDEFKIINKYLKPLSANNPAALKLNDDIYFDKKKGIAVSVDTYVEGVHFINSLEPKEFLKKVLRSSLSDLYCKGIKPKSYFLSFALNQKHAKPKWLKKVKNILSSEQKKFNIKLSGGDTTISSKLIITVIALGHSSLKPILRSGCNIGDDIYVTGLLGDSYLGLSVLKGKKNFNKLNNYFVNKYYNPNLPTRFYKHLNKLATSSIDISDGVGRDLKNLLKSSNFGAIVDLNLIPLSSACKKLLKSKKINLKNIFSKGDDYQILFTSSSKNRSKIVNLSKKINTKISKIGSISKNRNIYFNYNGCMFRLNAKKMGYTHIFN